MHPRWWLVLLVAVAGVRARSDATASGPGTNRMVVALVGGTDLVEIDEDGTLEALVRMARPGAPLTFRSLAWEGDTVLAQPRDVNHPDLPAELRHLGADLVLVQFGRMEALDPGVTAGEFARAYEDLLDRLLAVTPRCMVIAPRPFAPSATLTAAGADRRNRRMGEFERALRPVVAARHLPYLPYPGIPTPPGDDPSSPAGSGREREARSLAAGLLAAGLGDPAGNGTPAPVPSRLLTEIRAGVREKNRLWNHHRRPTNWAFLAGDRTEQAFGRDPVDRSIRALALETEAWRLLVGEADRHIDAALLPFRQPEATR